MLLVLLRIANAPRKGPWILPDTMDILLGQEAKGSSIALRRGCNLVAYVVCLICVRPGMVVHIWYPRPRQERPSRPTMPHLLMRAGFSPTKVSNSSCSSLLGFLGRCRYLVFKIKPFLDKIVHVCFGPLGHHTRFFLARNSRQNGGTMLLLELNIIGGGDGSWYWWDGRGKYWNTKDYQGK